MEIDMVQRDFPALCQNVASTGKPVVVTRDLEPLVSIVPAPQSKGGEQSVWELRREFEQRHGALIEDFELPARHLDQARWTNPLKD